MTQNRASIPSRRSICGALYGGRGRRRDHGHRDGRFCAARGIPGPSPTSSAARTASWRTLLPEALRRIPRPLYRYSGQGHEIRLCNGSPLRFRHRQRMWTAFSTRGAEIHWLYIDELTHFHRRCTSSSARACARRRISIRPVVRATSNRRRATPGSGALSRPPAAGHRAHGAWRPRASPGSARCAHIPRARAGQPHLAPGCAGAGRKTSGAPGRAALRPVGRVRRSGVYQWRDDPAAYGTGRFTRGRPFPIPESWRRFRSFDFGYSRPFSVGWWALDPHGTLVALSGVVRLHGRAQRGPAPDADGHRAGHRRGGARTSVSLLRRASGPLHLGRLTRGASRTRCSGRASTSSPAENARLAGLMQVHRRLEFTPRGRSGSAGLLHLPGFDSHAPGLSYDAQRLRGRWIRRARDHIYDSGGISSWPIPPGSAQAAAPALLPWTEDSGAWGAAKGGAARAPGETAKHMHHLGERNAPALPHPGRKLVLARREKYALWAHCQPAWPAWRPSKRFAPARGERSRGGLATVPGRGRAPRCRRCARQAPACGGRRSGRMRCARGLAARGRDTDIADLLERTGVPARGRSASGAL